MQPVYLILIFCLGVTHVVASERPAPAGLQELDTREMEAAMVPSVSVQFDAEQEEVRKNERQWLQRQEAMAADSSGVLPTAPPDPLRVQEPTPAQLQFRDNMINSFGDLARDNR